MVDIDLLPLVYSVDDKLGIKDIRSLKLDISWYDLCKIQDYMKKNNIWSAIYGGKDYHFKFSHIKSKPYIYYRMGDIDLLNKKTIGVVWPRTPTTYGKKIVSELLSHLTHYDVATVSGLADGIDMLTHTQSIKNNIPTIAVLGGGFHHFLKTKKSIIDDIISHGWLVISEFKLLSKPSAFTFPQRNRIIAWLSDVLFLPEWGVSSGSLITVDFALSGHKPVFATPNQIRSASSQWVNKLISSWEVTAVRDLLSWAEDQFSKYKKDKDNQTCSIDSSVICDPKHRKILEVIASDGSVDIDRIISKTQMDYSDVIVALSMLEITGNIIQNTPGIYEIWR